MYDRPNGNNPGSSPHTRGTVLGRPPSGLPSAVHPRTRGEQRGQAPYSNVWTGSSPHTRGTVASTWICEVAFRFIPAHAGNSPRLSVFINSAPVHPRTRGEQTYLAVRRQCKTGSSPHTRGTGEITLTCTCYDRFIPAHAGNSLPILSY